MMKHELLLELVSRPILEEQELSFLDLGDVSSHEILELRRFLRFNEQEILIRPFTYTKEYLSYKEIEKISETYFAKYGLHREMYTKKIKSYGITLLKYLFRHKKPKWLLDIARYEYKLFSQLWIYEPNNGKFFRTQSSLDRYRMNDCCKLGRFSFDIESYMENPEKRDFLFQKKFDQYLVFIGNYQLPSVYIKNIDKRIYSLIRFCAKPRTITEIGFLLEKRFSCQKEESLNLSRNLVKVLESWEILTQIPHLI